MKKKKNLFIAGLFLFMSTWIVQAVLLSSSTTTDQTLTSKAETEAFLDTLFLYGIHSNLPYGTFPPYDGSIEHFANPDPTLSSGASDESETCAQWYNTQKWNDGSVSPFNTDDDRYYHRIMAISKCNILLRDVDGIPDLSEQEKNQIKAEAKFIRALNYFEMFKRYGGMPVIENAFDPNKYAFEYPRNSLKEMIDFIVKNCDESIPGLPAFGSAFSPDKGKITRGASYALKAKVLLYAASPLYNTAIPYMSFKNPTFNSLVCYGNYDKSRWKLAAQAAKDVLVWASQYNCSLITGRGVENNYRVSWEEYDNAEIIFAQKQKTSLGCWTWPWSAFSKHAPGNWGESGVSPTMNFISKYEKRDGTKQQWAKIGTTGYDLQEKLLEMEYRFQYSVSYNMSKWNNEQLHVPFYQEAIPVIEGPGTHWDHPISGINTGFYLHKLYPYIIDSNTWRYTPNSTLFQLNEIYLNYAEAVYEFYGSGDATLEGYSLTARQAINIIRERSGQPPVNESIYNGSFREAIRNERAIELAFDNHRFWDIRRWMIADDGINNAMQSPIVGIKINLIDPTVILIDPNGDPSNLANINLNAAPINYGYKYTPYIFEVRSFKRRMYMHPLPIAEINKGLEQNPSYDELEGLLSISNDIKIYPNPTSEGFYVSGIGTPAMLTISDLSGKLVLTKQVKNKEYVSFAPEAKGIYIIKLNTGNETFVKKLIKK
jgi:hypothetical protein